MQNSKAKPWGGGACSVLLGNKNFLSSQQLPNRALGAQCISECNNHPSQALAWRCWPSCAGTWGYSKQGTSVLAYCTEKFYTPLVGLNLKHRKTPPVGARTGHRVLASGSRHALWFWFLQNLKKVPKSKWIL